MSTIIPPAWFGRNRTFGFILLEKAYPALTQYAIIMRGRYP